MTELHFTPEQVGKLTLTQVACICSARPPGSQQGSGSDDSESW